jgi:large subunit ribosomal protein L20
LLRAARGYWGTKHRHAQQAKVALLRAGQFAYRDRRARRRDFRRLWIVRIGAACRMRGTRYSRFINGLQRAGVLLNRKMISQIAIEDPATFDRLVEMAEASASAPGGDEPARPPATAEGKPPRRTSTGAVAEVPA